MKKNILIALVLSLVLGTKVAAQDSTLIRAVHSTEELLALRFKTSFDSIYRRITKKDVKDIRVSDLLNLARWSQIKTSSLLMAGIEVTFDKNNRFGSVAIKSKYEIDFVKVGDSLVGIEIWKRNWSIQYWQGKLSLIGYKDCPLPFHFIFSDGETSFLYPYKKNLEKKFIRRLRRAIRWINAII